MVIHNRLGAAATAPSTLYQPDLYSHDHGHHDDHNDDGDKHDHDHIDDSDDYGHGASALSPMIISYDHDDNNTISCTDLW